VEAPSALDANLMKVLRPIRTHIELSCKRAVNAQLSRRRTAASQSLPAARA
jgi:hypothetical protein